MLHINTFDAPGRRSCCTTAKAFTEVHKPKNHSEVLAGILYNCVSFAGILHVSYAPEHETLSDLREKFEHRKKSVAGRLNALGKQFSDACDGTGQMTNAVTKRHRQQINEQSMKSGSGFGHKY